MNLKILLKQWLRSLTLPREILNNIFPFSLLLCDPICMLHELLHYQGWWKRHLKSTTSWRTLRTPSPRSTWKGLLMASPLSVLLTLWDCCCSHAVHMKLIAIFKYITYPPGFPEAPRFVGNHVQGRKEAVPCRKENPRKISWGISWFWMPVFDFPLQHFVEHVGYLGRSCAPGAKAIRGNESLQEAQHWEYSSSMHLLWKLNQNDDCRTWHGGFS